MELCGGGGVGCVLICGAIDKDERLVRSVDERFGERNRREGGQIRRTGF
jgi:hypothetical protein